MYDNDSAFEKKNSAELKTTKLPKKIWYELLHLFSP